MRIKTFRDLIVESNIFQKSELKNIFSVSGGSIHNCWKIELINNESYFLKTTTSENHSMLLFERDCLIEINNYVNPNYLTCPKPISIVNKEGLSLLILPWLDLNSGNQRKLGIGLAKLHQKSSKKYKGEFGWANDGFIGSNIQKGGFDSRWGDFFVKFRLIPQLEMALKNRLITTDQNDLLEDIRQFLNEEFTEASLVHGDLWSGNASTNKNEIGLIFDPACYWADKGVDIAMTKLFGGYTKSFYDGYEEISSLGQLSPLKEDIYNLYHMLNHANLFQGHYIQQTSDLITKIRCLLNG